MGVEVGVLLERGRVPSNELWQGALDALALPVQLPESFDIASDHGACTFTLGGDPVSVEIGLVDSADRTGWAAVGRALGRTRRRRIGDRDTFVTFRWGGDPDAAACATAAAAALALVADAKLWDLEADEVLDAEDAVELARSSAATARLYRNEERPLRAKEAARLWRTSLVPVLQEATGEPVSVRGWTLVVGQVGWFARLLSFSRSSGVDDRAVKITVLLPQLYGLIPPWSINDVALELGRNHRHPNPMVHIPVDPGPALDAAVRALTDRVVDEAVPHLERYGSLAALAEANEAALRVGTKNPEYALDNLAGAQAILGDERATATYRRLVEHLDELAARRGGLGRLADWEQRLRQRGMDLQELIGRDPSAGLTRLAEHARINATESGLGEPDLRLN